MKMKWRKLAANLVLWFLAEIILSFLGLDELADYSEFLAERNSVAILTSSMI